MGPIQWSFSSLKIYELKTYGVRVINSGEAQGEALKTAFFPVLFKRVNRKQYLIQANMTEGSAASKDLGNARMVFPITSLYNH